MHEFAMPVINRFGAGSIGGLGNLAAMAGGRKALLITDKNLMDCGVAGKVITALEEAKLPYAVFSGVQPNPSKENVYEALALYKAEECDFIVGVGGGSPNDCAKAVGILAANGGQIEDYAGGNRSQKPSVPVIAVNTTAGTASEISRAYIISDEEKKEKIIAKDIHAMPFAAINDSELMLNLPASVTAATGMDALSHAVESYVCNIGWFFTREIAEVSVRLVFNNLRRVIAEPHNVGLRDAMIAAQTAGGMAFCNSGVGIAHSLAHALGATYNLPHGLCTAIMLPPVIQYNREFAGELYAKLARAVFPVQTQELGDAQCVDLLVEEICRLSEDVGTARSLSSLGVKRDDLLMLADKALRDGNTGRNPVVPEISDFVAILEEAF